MLPLYHYRFSIILAIVLLFSGSMVFAQAGYSKLISHADSLYKAKQYAESADGYAEALKIQKKNPIDLYNAACSFALAGRTEQAIQLLNDAVKNEYGNVAHLKQDSDLNSLHPTEGWQQLLATMAKLEQRRQAGYNQPVKQELEAIFATDQGIRNQYLAAQKKYGYHSRPVDSLVKMMMHHDSINIVKVSRILDQYGWLSKDKVGSTGNTTLFLVVQHSGLKTQQKYLPLMRAAVKRGNADPSSLALLEDRLALAEGRHQIYGSQVSAGATPEENYVRPLADPDHVDERRAAVGLQPLADYVKYWNMTWDAETYKKQLPAIEKREGFRK
jgi:hypothetical protein